MSHSTPLIVVLVRGDNLIVIIILYNALVFIFLVSLMDSVYTILKFDTCDTRQCTEIPIADDLIVVTESFFVTLERTPGLDSRITLDPVDGEIEITDDDGVYIIMHTIFRDVHGLLHSGCGGFGDDILRSLRVWVW